MHSLNSFIKLKPLAAALLILSLTSCQERRQSIGSEKEILVFADSLEYLYLHDELSMAFEKETATPWPEKTFELRWQPPQHLMNFTHKPRLLITGTLDKKNKASRTINSILNSRQKRKVKLGENFRFKTDDLWMKNQRLLILTTNHLDTLRQRISENQDMLFDLFHKPLLTRKKQQMFSLYEQIDIENELLKKYDWSIRVQHDYKIYKQFPEERFLMLRRVAPERWIFITWKTVHRSDQDLTLSKVIEWRNQIGQRFYNNDQIAQHELTSQKSVFVNRNALEVSGLWENNEKSAGGPFKSWMFYDDAMNALFLIDIAVFAPGIDKITYLQQLEIIARTFYTKYDRPDKTKIDS